MIISVNFGVLYLLYFLKNNWNFNIEFSATRTQYKQTGALRFFVFLLVFGGGILRKFDWEFIQGISSADFPCRTEKVCL